MNNQEQIKLLKNILREIYPHGMALRKGKIIKAYAVSDKYVADIEILKNDETPDESAPNVNTVEIPIIWAGENRGIICPPQVGMLCDIEYYAGDPNYPRISNFRPAKAIPTCELDELAIQQAPDTYIRIKPDGSFELMGNNIKVDLKGDAEINIDGNAKVKIKGDSEVTIDGDSKITVKGDLKAEVTGNISAKCTNAEIKASASVKVDSPNIDLGVGGAGVVTQACNCIITGLPHFDGSTTVRAAK